MATLHIELISGRTYDLPYGTAQQARDVAAEIMQRTRPGVTSWELFVDGDRTWIAVNGQHIASMEVRP